MVTYDSDEAQHWFSSVGQKRSVCDLLEDLLESSEDDDEARYLSKLLWLLEGGEPSVSTEKIIMYLKEPRRTVVVNFFKAIEAGHSQVNHWVDEVGTGSLGPGAPKEDKAGEAEWGHDGTPTS